MIGVETAELLVELSPDSGNKLFEFGDSLGLVSEEVDPQETSKVVDECDKVAIL